jgi:hypothetical protein
MDEKSKSRAKKIVLSITVFILLLPVFIFGGCLIVVAASMAVSLINLYAFLILIPLAIIFILILRKTFKRDNSQQVNPQSQEFETAASKPTEKTSKMTYFWLGLGLSFFLPNIIPLLGMLVFPFFGIFGMFSPIFIFVLLILIPFLVIRSNKNPHLKYFMLGVLTAVGATLIFLGTCFSGAMIGSQFESGEFAGMGGAMISLPIALILVGLFVTAIYKKLSKAVDEKNKAPKTEYSRFFD